MEFTHVLFLAFAALAVVAAFNIILQRNPIYCAIGLIVVLCALAGLFLTLHAQFIAAIQIIVYAGAIMVLFVFVIMLLNVREEESKTDRQKILKVIAVPLFLALLAEVFVVIRLVNNSPPAIASAADNTNPAASLGSVESIATAMFTTYVLPFEATSVLILMAIVGAMLLARKNSKDDFERIEQALTLENDETEQAMQADAEKSKEEVAA
ncbi:MAG: NADH-quinone oxidoreductase subunit J [Acidobacteria bacterium]|nr:NADH-quinone oxidoreductase subunit J [Acidobacteriota bacterium]MBK7601790.1 NADH-quinone oxidoreductase subunit J [Acidobacteriota bacterium]MBK8314003.1 NADH-quinone oxidoreductase subunit J [Acidobacteriota bacterium]MBK9709060.1 NADH-quinone oxidoreductase subunit J [Acidobacteriota bacterium]